ncbi:MAG: PEGA domain-containing protein, partial [Pseudomonadota bacterium]
SPAPPVALPQPPPPPPPATALPQAAAPTHAIREAELPPAPVPAPAVEQAPAAEPRFDQQELIEQRRQARLTFVEGVDLFNVGRYAEAEQRFLAFLAVFPGDNQGEHFLALTRKTLASLDTGHLRVTCRQPASVFLDGRPVGATPLALDNLPAGRHQVEVRAGDASQSQAVEIKGRTTTSIAFDLTRYEAPETPATAAPAAPGAYRHPGLGFSLTLPPGWQRGDTPADADLRLVPAQGQGFIQVNSIPTERQVDAGAYAVLWEQRFLRDTQPGAQRLASRARALAVGRAWWAEYLGDDVRTVVVFISRLQRMYVLTGAWPSADHERRLADFNAAVESFRAP